MVATWKMLYILAISALFLAMTVECRVSLPGCPEKCASLTVPYPFGIGDGCGFDESDSELYCNGDGVASLLLWVGHLPVVDISLDGYLKKYNSIMTDCYSQSGRHRRHGTNAGGGGFGRFFVSESRNKITAVGCDTFVRLTDSEYQARSPFKYGCITTCSDESMVKNGSCSGIGSSQPSVPQKLSEFSATLQSFANHSYVYEFNPCRYAFIADVDSYCFY